MVGSGGCVAPAVIRTGADSAGGFILLTQSVAA